jgi:hypothetical protein
MPDGQEEGLAEGGDEVAEMPAAELALAEGPKAEDAHILGENALCKHVRDDVLTIFLRHSVRRYAKPQGYIRPRDSFFLKSERHDLLGEDV